MRSLFLLNLTMNGPGPRKPAIYLPTRLLFNSNQSHAYIYPFNHQKKVNTCVNRTRNFARPAVPFPRILSLPRRSWLCNHFLRCSAHLCAWKSAWNFRVCPTGSDHPSTAKWPVLRKKQWRALFRKSSRGSRLSVMMGMFVLVWTKNNARADGLLARCALLQARRS